MLDNGQVTTNGEEVMDILFRTHFPASTPQPQVEQVQLTNLTLTEEVMTRYQFITISSLKQVYKTFGNYKAANDQLKPIVYKNLDDGTLEEIRYLYIASLALGIVPKRWKKATVIFIPKFGKTDYADPNAYRPIVLNCFMLKGLEKLLKWEMARHGIPRLHPAQYAFQQGKSIEIGRAHV